MPADQVGLVFPRCLRIGDTENLGLELQNSFPLRRDLEYAGVAGENRVAVLAGPLNPIRVFHLLGSRVPEDFRQAGAIEARLSKRGGETRAYAAVDQDSRSISRTF